MLILHNVRRQLYFIAAAVLFPGLILADAPESRELVTSENLSAQVSPEDWCAKEINLDVVGGKRNFFEGDRVELQELLGGARAALQFECSKAESASVRGIVAGDVVFRGHFTFSKDGGLVSAQLVNGQNRRTVDRRQAETLTQEESIQGTPGTLPDLPDEFSFTVEPSDGTDFGIDQLPPGVALAYFVEPFRSHPKNLKDDEDISIFASLFDCEGYKKAEKNEFFRREYVTTWRENIRKALDVLPDPAGYKIKVPISMEFGKYDFDQGGFPVKGHSNLFFAAEVIVEDCEDAPYYRMSDFAVADSIRVKTKLPSGWQPLLKMPEEEAAELAQSVEPGKRIVTGTMTVETRRLVPHKESTDIELSSLVRGPITVSLRNAPDIKWTLNPPEYRLDGRLCHNKPEVRRIRVMGADGLPYWVRDRSCKLLVDDRPYRTNLEIVPVEDPEPLAWNEYRATLVRIGSNPAGYSQDSEVVNELAAAIVDEHQTTYKKRQQKPRFVLRDTVSIAPQIDRQRFDPETPVQQQLEGELGEELRQLILQWARDMAQRQFVGVLRPSTLEFEVNDGKIEFDSLDQDAQEKLPNNLRLYRLATPEDAAETALNRPAPFGSELQMARNIQLGKWDAAPRKQLKQIADFQRARALIVFTARYAEDIMGAARVTGNLEHLVLEFYEPRSGDERTKSLQFQAKAFPRIDVQAPPLKVASRMPSKPKYINKFKKEGQDKDGIGVEFDRNIKAVAGDVEDAIDLQCDTGHDKPEEIAVGVSTETQGKTLKIYPKYIAGKLGRRCEYRIGTDAVHAANDGGGLEEPVTHSFSLGWYSAWEDAPEKELPPPSARSTHLDYTDDGGRFMPFKVVFGSEVSVANGVDLAERVSLRCDGQAVSVDVSINDETLTVQPSSDTSVDEGAPCTLSVAPNTVRRAEGSDTLPQEIQYELELKEANSVR